MRTCTVSLNGAGEGGGDLISGQLNRLNCENVKQKIEMIPNLCPSSIIGGGDHSRLLTSGCVALKVVHEGTISGREQTQ